MHTHWVAFALVVGCLLGAAGCRSDGDAAGDPSGDRSEKKGRRGARRERASAQPTSDTTTPVPGGRSYQPSGNALPQLSLVRTSKLEQVIGDLDAERRTPTRSRTGERFGVLGTDLGQSFEHAGKLYFLFGDTLHPPGQGRGGPDGIAWTSATSAAQGLPLEFVAGPDGKYLRVRPDDQPMSGFEVPVAGIDLDGVAWLVCKIDHATESEGDDDGNDESTTDRSVIVRWDEAARRFPIARTLSRLPDGRFLKVSLVREGEWIYVFGTGRYRKSPVYLQRVRAADFESGRGTEYFTSRGASGPVFARSESEAEPVVDHPTVGDVSVTRAGELWLMTYDSREPRGVLLRWAHRPEGPWSEPVVLFSSRDPEAAAFIRDPKQPRSPAGPVIGQGDPETRRGGAYAPYVVERFTRLEADRLELHYVLSTWNPYTVVLMRSELRVTRP